MNKGVSKRCLHLNGAIAPRTRPFFMQSGSFGCSRLTRSTSRGLLLLWTSVSNSPVQPPDPSREAITARENKLDAINSVQVTYQPDNHRD